MSALQIAWFVLIGVLLAGYVILDGYDLGVGFWHLLSRSPEERKALRNAILPYWDANEVWLITAGGALFAAFPMVYATVFSGFYLPLMLVVFGLIFRAVSLEFIAHAESPKMLRLWEWAFGIGSALPALLFGVAMGNILRGLPMDAQGNYTGTFFDLLNPYSLLVGLAGFALFAMHGALWIQMTQKGEWAENAQWRALGSFAAFAVLIIASRVASMFVASGGLSHRHPRLIPVVLFYSAAAAFAGVVTSAHVDKGKQAFLSSCAGIVLLFVGLGAALFPNFVPALGRGESLTLANSSSSELTLGIMLGVAAVGMVIVLAYTIWVRKQFRGGGADY